MSEVLNVQKQAHKQTYREGVRRLCVGRVPKEQIARHPITPNRLRREHPSPDPTH